MRHTQSKAPFTRADRPVTGIEAQAASLSGQRARLQVPRTDQYVFEAPPAQSDHEAIKKPIARRAPGVFPIRRLPVKEEPQAEPTRDSADTHTSNPSSTAHQRGGLESNLVQDRTQSSAFHSSSSCDVSPQSERQHGSIAPVDNLPNPPNTGRKEGNKRKKEGDLTEDMGGTGARAAAQHSDGDDDSDNVPAGFRNLPFSPPPKRKKRSGSSLGPHDDSHRNSSRGSNSEAEEARRPSIFASAPTKITTKWSDRRTSRQFPTLAGFQTPPDRISGSSQVPTDGLTILAHADESRPSENPPHSSSKKTSHEHVGDISAASAAFVSHRQRTLGRRMPTENIADSKVPLRGEVEIRDGRSGETANVKNRKPKAFGRTDHHRASPSSLRSGSDARRSVEQGREVQRVAETGCLPQRVIQSIPSLDEIDCFADPGFLAVVDEAEAAANMTFVTAKSHRSIASENPPHSTDDDNPFSLDTTRRNSGRASCQADGVDLSSYTRGPDHLATTVREEDFTAEATATGRLPLAVANANSERVRVAKRDTTRFGLESKASVGSRTIYVSKLAVTPADSAAKALRSPPQVSNTTSEQASAENNLSRDVARRTSPRGIENTSTTASFAAATTRTDTPALGPPTSITPPHPRSHPTWQCIQPNDPAAKKTVVPHRSLGLAEVHHPSAGTQIQAGTDGLVIKDGKLIISSNKSFKSWLDECLLNSTTPDSNERTALKASLLAITTIRIDVFPAPSTCGLMKELAQHLCDKDSLSTDQWLFPNVDRLEISSNGVFGLGRLLDHCWKSAYDKASQMLTRAMLCNQDSDDEAEVEELKGEDLLSILADRWRTRSVRQRGALEARKKRGLNTVVQFAANFARLAAPRRIDFDVESAHRLTPVFFGTYVKTCVGVQEVNIKRMLHGVTVIVPGVPQSYHLDLGSYPLTTANRHIIYSDLDDEDCEIDDLEPQGSIEHPVTDKARQAHRRLIRESTRSISVAHDFVADLELQKYQQIAITAIFAPKISNLISSTPISIIMPEDTGDDPQKGGSEPWAIKEHLKVVKAELHKSKKITIRQTQPLTSAIPLGRIAGALRRD